MQAPPILTDGSSSSTLDPRIFPTLSSNLRQSQLGSSFSLFLAGNPGGFQLLSLSLRSGPTRTIRGVDGFGFLDGTRSVQLSGQSLPPSGVLRVDLRVPRTTALLGATLFFQATERFTGSHAISNPVLVTITG